MNDVYLETGKVIYSNNRAFMIVEDDEGYSLLIDLKLGEIVSSSWDVNHFRNKIGEIHKQEKFKNQ